MARTQYKGGKKMFLGMQGDYIASISESREELEAVKDIANFSSIEETDEIVQMVGNEYFIGIENITNALKELRAEAYQQEVDPITCHIQRLEDEEQTPEIEQEIADLKTERSDKVEEIKERYPYPVEESDDTNIGDTEVA